MSEQEQPINRIVIETRGVNVTAESSAEPLDVVYSTAIRAFDHARLNNPDQGNDTSGSISLSAERRDTPPVQPSGMWAAPGPYPIQSEGARGD